MSTHSRIGILNDDNTVTSIYCQHDGYLSGVGLTLTNCYTDEDDVIELMGLGDISALDEDVESCEAYGRDHGEEDTEARVDDSLEEYQTQDEASYAYLFQKGTWYVSVSNEDFIFLTSDLIAEAEED